MTLYTAGYRETLTKLGFELADIPVPVAVGFGALPGALNGPFVARELFKAGKKGQILAAILGGVLGGTGLGVSHYKYRKNKGR